MSTASANPGRTSSLVAMLGAGILMAHQVGAKAARDAVFLSNYDPKALPAMVFAGAAASVLLGVLASRLLSRYTPSRIVPPAFLVSALLQFGEWRLLADQPKLGAVLVYLHMVALGAVLLSSFWSLTNEVLDPHTAKRRFGQIAATGTVGGILGGLAAASLNTSNILLWLGTLHLLGGIALMALRASAPKAASTRPQWWSEPRGSARQAFKKAPYLFSLAALVAIGTSSAAAVDWVFKLQATEHFGRGEPLLRFFGLFHTSVQILSLIVQGAGTRFFLERLGLGKTVGSLPAAIATGSVGALFAPVFPVITVLRGAEAVLRGSLFRSGYELFYTPLPVAEKRPAKSIIDVGVDRLGDALGAGITQFWLVLGTTAAPNRILLTVIGLAVAGIFVARRLDRGYVQALEKSLVSRAVELDLSELRDSTTRFAMRKSSGGLPAVAPQTEQPAAAEMPVPVAAPEVREPTRPRALEPVVQRMADLRSGRSGRVRVALLLSDPLDPVLSAQVISLLAWDDVHDLAREVLIKAAPRICGQLIDFLLDESQDFAIRRRIPRVLTACASQRAVDGLVAALSDSRFEVRFQSARGLEALLEGNPDLHVRSEAVWDAVDRELSVSRSVWEGHSLLDRRDPSEKTQFLDEVLRERANASLEHVFTLLALVLPREPLKVAFRALHTEDPLLRGLALEYLETVLPEGVREKLSRIVQKPASGERRTGDEIVESLMKSNQSVVLRLRQKLDKLEG
ncbi:MAG TPA: hypothetical protein VN428_06030 [Bryobacteraceae bacterium]|nr:hypothetical protein [Bryobacteraceae bacterium]